MPPPLSYVDEDGRVCLRCNEYQVWERYNNLQGGFRGKNGTCKECKNVAQRGKVDASKLVKNGWTLEQKMLAIEEQNGICANPNCDSVATDADHNHRTNQARAVLCRRCNLTLGYVHEDVEILEGLIIYIQQHQ